MKIRNVKSFEVFDLVHWNSRGAHTLVSLDLDGKTYYSNMLDGIRDVSSGEDVTVVFRDDEENSVLAWTDQRSHEMYHVSGSGSLVTCFFVFWMTLLLAELAGVLRMVAPIPAVAFAAILLSTCVLFARMYARRNRLEAAMRAYAEA